MTVSERPNNDVQRPSAILSQGTTDWLFRPGPKVDLLRKQAIVGGDPTVGGVTLRDGSGLSFDRDCRGDRCLYTGLSRVARPDACWNLSYDARKGDGDLVLGRNRVVVAPKGEGSEVRLVRNDPAAPPRSLLLLETASPIVGLNVSILSFHGGLRTFDVIRGEAGGTLVLTTYVFDHKVAP
ncbi:hypothetical protein [Sphingomonas glaciei]|uniref:Uncharacterized protein n=1 Tax=Sphingomonas glaciei TaxID=2938948 RepID=A0ABY5MZW4_9SPHN|nr:hypothetical protein [Sphingomonas glaciei]UUR09019.1 hypothetical protein M1K48_05205 [Sphingomonas glaciei]